jgi:hypothetical protein
MEAIYERPRDYDLQHEGDDEDVAFYLRLLDRWHKTTRYLPHEQRAEIRFLYDRFPNGDRADRYVSDFDCHVYHPREVELRFRITSFRVEAWFGDYAMRPLRPASRQLIGVGRKPFG